MPFFFQFSKNGRRADGTPGTKCAALNNSTMNDLCALVNGRKEDGGLKHDINMNFKAIDPFNYRMMLSRNERYFNTDVRQIFLDEIARVQSGIISENNENLDDYNVAQKNQLACDKIRNEVLKICTLEEAYETIVVDLYAGKNLDKVSSKTYFWLLFGDIAERNLTENLKNCHKCPICGQLVPNWDDDHQHQGEDDMHFRCPDCNKIFEYDGNKDNPLQKRNSEKSIREVKRCQRCYEVYRQQMKNSAKKIAREKKAELEYKKMIAERAEIVKREIEECGYSDI